MTDQANASMVVATDMRRAEQSIATAMRDTAQMIATIVDATASLGLSPAMTHASLAAAVTALSQLNEGQRQIAMRAHPGLEKVGRRIGLTETDWGVGTPKPDDAWIPLPSASAGTPKALAV